MSKRFTETDKWRDPWFRKLTPVAKLLFLWLVDNCDKAGVIDLDPEAAAFDIGQPIKPEHLAELDTRITKLENGKLCLPKFVPFQYGTLSKTCTPHIRVLETIKAHGLSYPLCGAKSTTLPPTLPSTLHGRVQEKKGMEKIGKDPEKTGGEGCGEGVAKRPDAFGLRDKLNSLYGRDSSPWSYHEEGLLAEVARRERCGDELDQIVRLKTRDPKFFPQSVEKLLSGWGAVLDRARATNGNKMASSRPPGNL